MDYEGQICQARWKEALSCFRLWLDAHIISVNSVIYSGI